MLASTTTFYGTIAGPTRVEIVVDIRNGLPAFSMIGVDDQYARESRERVRAAILNEGFEFPQRRITVSVSFSSPAVSIVSLDLAIAAAILKASGQVTLETARTPMLGELSLDGSIRPVHGALIAAEGVRDAGFECFVVPEANTGEAQLAGHPITSIKRLGELANADFPVIAQEKSPTPTTSQFPSGPDLKDLRGHASSISLLRIAAAGGHNTLFFGPPGCGKTMLARRLPSILPPMTCEEALEVTRVASVTGLLRADGAVENRPFRAPHHSISQSGIEGNVGKSHAYPGEASIAHRGVLFLDELSEFSSRTLEAISRITREREARYYSQALEFTAPADFQLIAASNPCACGAGDRRCRCSESQREIFTRRLTRIDDLFDVFGNVSRPTPADVEAGPVTTSAEVRADVIQARQIQQARYADVESASCNGELDATQTHELIELSSDARTELARGYASDSLSLLDCERHIRVARTIADLEAAPKVTASHIINAANYIAFLNAPTLEGSAA